jgi:predicted RNA-binding protein with PIN domain
MEDIRAAAALLLIDGYNLLHETPWLGRARTGVALERARERLAAELSAALGEIRQRTIIVYDAPRQGRAGPASAERDGIQIRFAYGHEDADALLAELIQRCTAPRRLTVVSSDHQVARAARRRGARSIGSREWYAALRSGRILLAVEAKSLEGECAEQARDGQSPPTDPDAWLRWFNRPENRQS